MLYLSIILGWLRWVCVCQKSTNDLKQGSYSWINSKAFHTIHVSLSPCYYLNGYMVKHAFSNGMKQNYLSFLSTLSYHEELTTLDLKTNEILSYPYGRYKPSKPKPSISIVFCIFSCNYFIRLVPINLHFFDMFGASIKWLWAAKIHSLYWCWIISITIIENY